MGPFTQEDPIGIAGGLNLYGYANGDPINFSDPFGLSPCPDEDDPDCQEGGGTVSTAVSLSAARYAVGGNVEFGVAQNASGDLLFFAKGGQSFGYGQSAALEGGANTGSFNDFLAPGMGVEVEAQLGSHGFAATLADGGGSGLHYQKGLGSGVIWNLTTWSRSFVVKNPLMTVARWLSKASKPACLNGPTPTC